MEELSTSGLTQFQFVKCLNKKQVSSVYTYPARKPELNLSVCFEILKLIYPITVYRLHELTGSPRKQIIPLLGIVVQGRFILHVMALHSFLFSILIFLSVSWVPGIGDNSNEEKR